MMSGTVIQCTCRVCRVVAKWLLGWRVLRWIVGCLRVVDCNSTLRSGDCVAAHGIEFLWSNVHLRGEDLDPWRKIGDPDADEVVSCDELRCRDVLNELCKAAALDSGHAAVGSEAQATAAEFLTKVSELPSWVDLDRVNRGCDVFIQYLPAAGASLFYMGLVGGFSAPLITEVLQCTGYLSGAGMAPTRRMLETLQMIAACVLSRGDGFVPGGEAHSAVLRVRFLHAKVRKRLLQGYHKNDKRTMIDKSITWDVDKYGIPVNQEDLAVTLLAFSVNVLVGIELALGWELTESEKLDYIHLWRVIGWLIGLDDSFNPCAHDVHHAHSMLESILMHILEPNDVSRRVAMNLLQSPLISGRRPDIYARFEITKHYLGPQWTAELFPNMSSNTTAKIKAFIHYWVIRIVTIASVLPIVSSFVFLINRWILRLVFKWISQMNPIYDIKTSHDIKVIESSRNINDSFVSMSKSKPGEFDEA